MTDPRPPLRLVGSPPTGGHTDGAEPDDVERAPHDLHPPYRELVVVDDDEPEADEGEDDPAAAAKGKKKPPPKAQKKKK